MTRVSTITALAVVGVIALIVYASLSNVVPTEVVPKGSGEGEELRAWLALGTGILSLAASTIGLLMKLIELRERRRAKS